jgi:hypothetical protein
MLYLRLRGWRKNFMENTTQIKKQLITNIFQTGKDVVQLVGCADNLEKKRNWSAEDYFLLTHGVVNLLDSALKTIDSSQEFVNAIRTEQMNALPVIEVNYQPINVKLTPIQLYAISPPLYFANRFFRNN